MASPKPVPPALLQLLAGRFGVSPDALTPLRGGNANYVYELPRSGQACVLKITPPGSDIDLPGMRATLEWLAFLTAQGGPAPAPLRSLDGRLIETASEADGEYLAVAFEKAPGVLAEGMPPDDWSDGLFQALGRTIGKCHRIARHYEPPSPELKRPEWSAIDNRFNPVPYLPGADPVILARWDEVLRRLQFLPKDEACFGLAHLDLHFGNFFVDAERESILLFDFDDCGYGWYVMDLAMLLFDVLVVYGGQDREAFGERFLEKVLRGYVTQNAISSYWVSQLPLFLKQLETSLYIELYQDYTPESVGWWGKKFMPGRGERIVQETPYVEIDFEAVWRRATTDIMGE